MGCSSRADDADVYERRYNGVATHDVHDVIIFAVSPRDYVWHRGLRGDVEAKGDVRASPLFCVKANVSINIPMQWSLFMSICLKVFIIKERHWCELHFVVVVCICKSFSWQS